MASWTLAEVIWGYSAPILNVAVPVDSWAAVGYLSAIPTALAALVVPGDTRQRHARTRWLLAGLVVATARLFPSWTRVLGPPWRAPIPAHRPGS